MLVQDFLRHSAARLPDKVALICGEQRLSYAQLDAMADRLAHALIVQGVGRGDRVAIHLQNSVEAVVGIFGALKAGGTFVVVNASTKQDKLLYILNNCRTAALLADVRSLEDGSLVRVLAGVPSLKDAFLCGDSFSGSPWPRHCHPCSEALVGPLQGRPPE